MASWGWVREEGGRGRGKRKREAWSVTAQHCGCLNSAQLEGKTILKQTEQQSESMPSMLTAYWQPRIRPCVDCCPGCAPLSQQQDQVFLLRLHQFSRPVAQVHLSQTVSDPSPCTTVPPAHLDRAALANDGAQADDGVGDGGVVHVRALGDDGVRDLAVLHRGGGQHAGGGVDGGLGVVELKLSGLRVR